MAKAGTGSGLGKLIAAGVLLWVLSGSKPKIKYPPGQVISFYTTDGVLAFRYVVLSVVDDDKRYVRLERGPASTPGPPVELEVRVAQIDGNIQQWRDEGATVEIT